jgi:hypothetical protein
MIIVDLERTPPHPMFGLHISVGGRKILYSNGYSKLAELNESLGLLDMAKIGYQFSEMARATYDDLVEGNKKFPRFSKVWWESLSEDQKKQWQAAELSLARAAKDQKE